MKQELGRWELTILDNPACKGLGCLVVGDLDGDGCNEVVTGGIPSLLWYRPATGQKGVIANGFHFHVGGTFEDIDGDGRLEVFVGMNTLEGEAKGEPWKLAWFKPGRDLNDPWTVHILDPRFEGGPHDIIFADLDGDGRRELLAIACYTATPGIFAYKPSADPTQPWKKHAIQQGLFTEGLSVGDLNGDGKLEIVCGPDWYCAPAAGPWSGTWRRETYAPNFREMCRTACVDITGNGRPDVVITDSEYMDGYLSWFENRLLEDPERPWVEHRLEDSLIYAHSLDVKHDPQSGRTTLFVAEMDQGGWNAPFNFNARLIRHVSADRGRTWQRELVYRGEGTHQAVMADMDGDGEIEIIGKTDGAYWANPKLQLWKFREKPALNVAFRHRLIDRDKPLTATDILAADLRGSGVRDVLCGCWWYRNSTWQRYDLPAGFQAINVYDVDRDGRQEVIAFKLKAPDANSARWNDLRYTSEMYWLKPIEPEKGKWEVFEIGEGTGDWPHGTAIGPILPNGRLALLMGYHSAGWKGHIPEYFVVPDDPKKGPWERRPLADIKYGEEFVICDVDGDGRPDIVAGAWWLHNRGDGIFEPRVIAEGLKAARVVVADINGDGRPDVVIGEEIMDFEKKIIPFSKLAWFENPGGSSAANWKMYVIDSVRCAHSLGVGDLDGDGQPEIVCGEHDPFWPYRSRCRLMLYKKADPKGDTWHRCVIDDRFEHHDGAKVVELAPAKPVILSHGWQDKIYVHLWEPCR